MKMIPYSHTWSVVSRKPVSDNRWDQIEVRNHSVYGVDIPQARLVGSLIWFNISNESCGDILENLKDGKITYPDITYRVFNSELITLRRDDGYMAVRISVKGRTAKTTLFGKEITLY